MKRTYYPLSSSQRTLRAAQIYTLEPRRVQEFNVISWYVSVPDGDAAAMEKAYARLLAEHASLRLRLVRHFPAARQYIAEPGELPPPRRAQLASAEELPAAMENERSRRMPPFGDPLARAVLFCYPGGMTLFMRFHHYCFDGYSIGLAARCLKSCYEAFLAGKEPSLPAPRYTIEDYFRTDGAYRSSEKHREDVAYWREANAARKDFRLPLPRRAIRGDTQARDFPIAGEDYAVLSAYSRSCGVPLSSLLLSMAALTVCKRTGRRDFAFAPIVHGRSSFVQKQLVGCLMQTFLAYYRIDESQPLRDFFRAAYMDYLEGCKHIGVTPFERLFVTLRTALRLCDPNFYSLMYSVLDFGGGEEDFRVGLLPHGNLPHQIYCSVEDDRCGCVTLHVNYQTRRFTQEKVEEIRQSCGALLRRLAEAPEDADVGWMLRG